MLPRYPPLANNRFVSWTEDDGARSPSLTGSPFCTLLANGQSSRSVALFDERLKPLTRHVSRIWDVITPVSAPSHCTASRAISFELTCETWTTLSSRFGPAQTQFLFPDSSWCSTPVSHFYKDSLDNEWTASPYTEALLSCNTTIYSSARMLCISNSSEASCVHIYMCSYDIVSHRQETASPF